MEKYLKDFKWHSKVPREIIENIGSWYQMK